MSIGLPLLGLGIVLALVAGFAIWVLLESRRTRALQLEEFRSRMMHHQPWASDRGFGRGVR